MLGRFQARRESVWLTKKGRGWHASHTLSGRMTEEPVSWLLKARGLNSANFVAVFVRRNCENQLKFRYSGASRRH